MGRSVSELISSQESVEQGAAILDGLRNGQSWSGEYVVRRRDGGHFPVYVTDTPVFGESGALVAIIAVSVDITERRAGEEARRQLAAIVAGSGDAIFGMTVDGTVTSWNAAAEELFGYTAAEMVGARSRCWRLAAPRHEQVEVQASSGRRRSRRAVRNGPPPQGRQHGGSAHRRLVRRPTRRGKVVGLSVIAHDITERGAQPRALEASQHRLAEAQRIAHLGSFEFDGSTGEMTWSEEQYRILGLDPSVTRPVPSCSSRWSTPTTCAADGPGLGGAVEGRFAFELVFRIIRADSEERWVHGRACARSGRRRHRRQAGRHADGRHRTGRRRPRCARRRRAASRSASSRPRSEPRSPISPGCRSGSTRRCATSRRPAEELVGRAGPSTSTQTRCRSGGDLAAPVGPATTPTSDERRYLRPDGSVVWASSHITLVRDEAGAAPVLLRPVSGHHRAQADGADLAHQALHDSLTGLPNRALLDRPAGPRAGRIAAARLAARRDLPRHRSLQGDQRLPGPRLR